ncbi:HesA/MoeB/ThiF family protein [Desulfoplanes formicivorans]|uniref:Molybdopterin biosynthesis protein MoeB n=1 Tax=Desulfoplanes formicivorans TaxID=1592317 RepID=A0A194AF98_9BACT|nr:ThiF family adenylyltransferase [Desulfoplanes formicivorans]GAU08008.1 molybdopterin biosynthesis protein MoeB [Desulfoplanes formicivorans]
MPWSPLLDRYARNRTSLEAVDQERLRQSHVLVAGAGGLGGYVVELLARIGVGRLTIVDGDRFEPSNLNRQLLCLEDNLGSPKAEAAKARVARIDKSVVCDIVPAFLDIKGFAQRMAGVSMVVDALGGISAHRNVCTACKEQDIPLATGAVAGWTGLAATVLPGGPDPDVLWQADDARDAERTLGSLAPAAACIASVQCAETVAWLTGKEPFLAGKMIIVDLRNGLFERLDL